MWKKFALLMLCVLPVALSAQSTFKLGHVNSQEILMNMPEVQTIEKTLDELQTQWESELLKMREEYYAKIKELQDKEATMPESIKQVRQSEIAEMEQKIVTFNQQAGQDIQRKQQELLTPVIEKIRKAIDEVGAENSFTYIFDLATQSILYQGSGAQDVTPMVKTKLGVK